MATITTQLTSTNAAVTAYLAAGSQAQATVAPIIANVGTPGAVQHQYEIVSVLPGVPDSVPSAIGQTTTGSATLNGTNYNTVTWTPVVGAAAYKVLRQTGGSGGFTLIATVPGTVNTYNDQSSTAGAAYTATVAGGLVQPSFTSVSGTSFNFPTTAPVVKGTSDASGNVSLTTASAGLHWLVVETADGQMHVASATAS